MKSNSRAIAYPGLPVIFAEGFRDYKKRISGHSHASLALTDTFERVRTETYAEATGGGTEFTIDGKTPDDSRSAGIYNLINQMLSKATDRIGVKINSVNKSIVTGSSDSGAAALVTALDDLLQLNLRVDEMVDISCQASETSYRSLLGGLSQYVIDDKGNGKAVKIKKASYFRDLLIYAIPFEMRRFSADDLHLRVVRHPQYPSRGDETVKHLERLQRIVDENDLLGFMQLMETEAKTVHRMFSEMGMEVIRGRMREAVDLVDAMKERGVQAYWNVAGGSQVYVFTLMKWAKEVTRELKDGNFRYTTYKVADGSRTF